MKFKRYRIADLLDEISMGPFGSNIKKECFVETGVPVLNGSNIRPYFKKIVYCEDTCGCSTDVLCFTPVQSQYAAYLFSTLYTDKFFAFMVAGSKGTKMPRGDKQHIMTYPIVLPTENELEEFNAIAFPVIEQINSNKVENKRLSALRDALLPKLLSGEIDISTIDF